MAHQRIVDNGRTQNNTCAEPWGCWCGWEYCRPDCAANLHVDIFTDPGRPEGVRRLERAARPLHGGLGSDTSVARSRPAVGHPTCWHVI